MHRFYDRPGRHDPAPDFVPLPKRSTEPGQPLHLRAASLPVVQCSGGYGLLTEHACRSRHRLATGTGKVGANNDAGLEPDMVYQVRASRCGQCSDGARRCGTELRVKPRRVAPNGERICACGDSFEPQRCVQVRCPRCIERDRDRDNGNRERHAGRTWGRNASEGGRSRVKPQEAATR